MDAITSRDDTELETGVCVYCGAEKALIDLDEMTRAVDVGGAYRWEHDGYYCADETRCNRRKRANTRPIYRRRW